MDKVTLETIFLDCDRAKKFCEQAQAWGQRFPDAVAEVYACQERQSGTISD